METFMASAETLEYNRWLILLEKRAIVPIKWLIFFISLVGWMWMGNQLLLDKIVFVSFLIYFMQNLFFSYCFYLNRVKISEIRYFSLSSLAFDTVFITLLLICSKKISYGLHIELDYYIFYFLIILRGFAVFRHRSENIILGTVISGLFILSVYMSEEMFNAAVYTTYVIKFFLIWSVILISWFLIDVINKQKAEILKIKERLITSEDLAMIGEIAAGVAHEINNPIGIISAYSEYLLKKTKEDDPCYDDFKTIQAEAGRCKKIVEELLNYAKPSIGAFQNCDLNVIVDEVIMFTLLDKKENKVEIEKIYADDIPTIYADMITIKQAVLNVLINAKQAIVGDKGKILVSTFYNKEKELVVLSIKDNGKGIEKEKLKKIFEPFYTGKKDGTGLGLAITKRIVEANNGIIDVKSNKGEGTEVSLHLPKSKE